MGAKRFFSTFYTAVGCGEWSLVSWPVCVGAKLYNLESTPGGWQDARAQWVHSLLNTPKHGGTGGNALFEINQPKRAPSHAGNVAQHYPDFVARLDLAEVDELVLALASI